MQPLFDITKFDSYKEDNRREVKKANGGLPMSLWDTYSAFANCYGGVIILGVAENKDGTWRTTGLDAADKGKLIKQFWDTINNRKKVNINILRDEDVETYDVNGDLIIVIYVPMAKREEKPVYINDDLFGGTYRRNHEGDYRCTRLQVKTMLRDQAEETTDMTVLDEALIEDLNKETIRGYRNSHKSFKPGHPFERLDDEQYLRAIGAAGISKEDKQLHPTVAGMIMFGNEYDIIRYFPEYFLDYREDPNPVTRWTDRIQSSSGEWSGNVFDFYFRVYNKLIKDLKVPFKVENGVRVDDTPVHRALREALANCIINTDFYGKYGIVIEKQTDRITMANPGYIRPGKEQMRRGGLSDPRNKVLMKMFNMIDIGEHAGSGVPDIFNTWADEGWKEPVIEESFEPDRTTLTLEFKEKSADKKASIKSADKKAPIKSADKKVTKKTQKQYDTILEYMESDKEYALQDFCELLNLKESRVKEILKGLAEFVEPIGSNRNRKYRKRK